MNAGVNVIVSVSVSMFPLELAVVLLPSARKHWLFESVPLVPTVACVQLLPASFNSESALADRSYDTRQEWAALDAAVALNQTHAVDKFVAPAVSEYCSPNV